MPASGAERWFHTLVVVGASLGGCGGRTTQVDPGVSGGATGASGGATSAGGSSNAGTGPAVVGVGGLDNPSACVFAAQFVCQDYQTLSGCRCDPAAPRTASDCESQFDFVCTQLSCSPSAPALCNGASAVGCHCDPSAPRPADCATPEQFYCGATYPSLRNCACRPAVDPTSCSPPDFYCCQSHDPRFGCGCDCAEIR